jgi:hypothetical protein
MNALSTALQSLISSRTALDSLARQAGIMPRQVSLARSGKAINAGAHLALCAAAGVDPVDGAAQPVKVVSADVVWWLLSGALYITRNLRKLDQRGAATAIGVSPSTVCRVECGKPVSAENMIKVCAFIGVHPYGYSAPLGRPGVAVSRGTSTETCCSNSDIKSDAAARDVSA